MSNHGAPVVERNWMLAYGVTLGVLTTIILGLRIYSRIPGQLGLDDIFIVIGWALGMVSVGLTIWICQSYGINRHVWDVPSVLWPMAFKLNFIISLVAVSSTSCIKISVLLFYRRLVSGVFSRPLKWSLRGAMIFVVLYSVAFLGFTLAQCTPIKASWSALDVNYHGPRKCLPRRTIQVVATALSIISVLTDFITVTLPAILIFTRTQIRFTSNQRIALLAIFGLGYLTVGAGIVRTIYLVQGIDSLQWDKTWVAFNAFVAGLAETNVGIICACAPSLNRLFGRFFRGSSASNSKYGAGPSSGAKQNDKPSSTETSQQHSSTTGTTDEPEEADMHFYGKSFYLDQTTDPSGQIMESQPLRRGSDIRVTPYSMGDVRTVIEGPHSPKRHSVDRAWPLP